MIISHKHKFIFIKTEKTAGTSVEIALSKYCGPDDVISKLTPWDEDYRKELGYPGRQNDVIPMKKQSAKDILWMLYKRRRRTFQSHSPASLIKQHIDPEAWNTYYKFCFERNPYDKFVSWFYWTGGYEVYESMRQFIEIGHASHVKGFELYTIDAMPVVDRVYRFESLQESLDDIQQRIGLDERIILPPVKAKGHIRKDKAHYRDILTNYEREWISKIFAREIQYFDYKY